MYLTVTFLFMLFALFLLIGNFYTGFYLIGKLPTFVLLISDLCSYVLIILYDLLL
jgi:hypothetical protein